jgi:hypothetical protein
MPAVKQSDWAHIVEHKIGGILSGASGEGHHLAPPIDLDSLRELFHVLSVEERQMIPEAATEAVTGGFVVYLRNNFLEPESASSRRRFTLAHEFCHTLFYDCSSKVPRRVRGAPIGENVESLCHRGAGLLLVPAVPLMREVRSLGGTVTEKDIGGLAKKFRVSADVVLRRLQETTPARSDQAIILIGPVMEKAAPCILGSYSGPWILSHFERPTYGMPLEKWLGGASAMHLVLSGQFSRDVSGGRLVVGAPQLLSKSRLLLDIRIEPVTAGPAQGPETNPRF